MKLLCFILCLGLMIPGIGGGQINPYALATASPAGWGFFDTRCKVKIRQAKKIIKQDYFGISYRMSTWIKASKKADPTAQQRIDTLKKIMGDVFPNASVNIFRLL
jgi:hypothetical protein